MTDEREFWIQVRRGLSIVTHAIDAERAQDQFWATILRGLNIVVRAIEVRWRLPHSSIRTIGNPTEPPAEPLARSEERIGHQDAVQLR
jgi:hypothetical protein